MNRLSLIFFSFLFTFNFAFSQDKVAKKILDNLSEKGKSYTDITAEFKFNFSNSNKGIDENSKGKVWIKEDMYKLDWGTDLSIINNGEIVWHFMKEVPEVQIMKNDPDDEMNPSRIFTIYEKGYKYEYKGAESINSARIHKINLFQNENDTINVVTLYIDAEKTELIKIKIIEKGGGTSTYTITKFITNSNLPTSTFNFKRKDHPDVEIIDLR
jgi:outer membrane lipoprotein-sorting protein